MKQMRCSVYAGFGGLILLVLSGCVSDYSFNGSSPTGNGSSNNASSPNGGPGCSVGSVTSPLKVVFMVDSSTSTATTDPHCGERCSALNNFINSYGSNPNLSYSFSFFDTAVSEWNMNNGPFVSAGSQLTIFGDSSGLANAVSSFQSRSPTGVTNYSKAFSALQSLISADENSGSSEDYSVLFMSDGEPTDLICDGTNKVNSQGCLATGAIQSTIQSFLQAVSSNGSSKALVSAVYFGPANDNNAIKNLSTMASAGGGQFVNTNTTSNIVINDIIMVPGCN